MKTSRIAAAAAVLLTVAAAGLAQDAKTAAPRKDPQAQFEPPIGPGAGQAFLKTFEGEWSVERNFYPPGGGAPRKASGEASQKMVQDGRFLESNFTFHQDGKDSTGTGISGFDPKSGLFTTFWYDSRSTDFSVRQSRDPFDGMQIVLYSVSLKGSHGEGHESRTVSFLEDNGKRLIHRQYNMGPDGKEHVLMELILTKK
ncbi:MAG TPA: DUF1579 family protein [Thermoanaerobaculia bacterium]|nr:DUF1579 family protein [Thermoanaerobaculia bacterium]